MTDATTMALEAEPLPPRPRRKLVTPVGGVAGAVLIAACGFIGGVQVEKGRNTSSSAGNNAAGFARFGGTGTGTGTGTARTGGTGGTGATGATGTAQGGAPGGGFGGAQ